MEIRVNGEVIRLPGAASLSEVVADFVIVRIEYVLPGHWEPIVEVEELIIVLVQVEKMNLVRRIVLSRSAAVADRIPIPIDPNEHVIVKIS